MLNKAERHQVLKVFRLYSIVGLLPVVVDLTSWKLKAPSKWRKFLSVVSSSFFVLHGLYKIGSLAFTYCYEPNVQLHQLVIHAILAMASAMCIFWYYTLYISDPTLLAAYANITLLGNIGGTFDKRDQLKTQWTRRLKEYSMQDLIAIGLPYMIMLALLVTAAAYTYDPSMRLLLYAALPTYHQTWVTFGLCLLEEIRFCLILDAIAVPVWQMQVTSYDLVTNQLQILSETKNTRNVYRILCNLQLYVSIVNDVGSYLVFTWKLLSISLGILSGYAAVAHFSEYPLFGIMYYVILLDAVLIYTLIYDKAFNIPELFGQATKCKGLNKPDRFLRRQMLSIPRTGIKVGNFHKMERESTLIFMDFVLKNIVNMLVAYG